MIDTRYTRYLSNQVRQGLSFFGKTGKKKWVFNLKEGYALPNEESSQDGPKYLDTGEASTVRKLLALARKIVKLDDTASDSSVSQGESTITAEPASAAEQDADDAPQEITEEITDDNAVNPEETVATASAEVIDDASEAAENQEAS